MYLKPLNMYPMINRPSSRLKMSKGLGFRALDQTLMQYLQGHEDLVRLFMTPKPRGHIIIPDIRMINPLTKST